MNPSRKKILIVALILFGLGKLLQMSTSWVGVFVVMASDSPKPSDEGVALVRTINASLHTGAWFLSSLAFAVWAYFEAKREQTWPKLWAGLAFFATTAGLVIFYGYRLLARRRGDPLDAPDAPAEGTVQSAQTGGRLE